ncbi:MAG: DUF4493 domain-containing protein [Bacteroidales bacterium]|nr:DUF4493 domain-containing protein [Bacteroidales bacterium]
MKRVFLAALATMMLAGCGKEGYDWGSKGELESNDYGQVTLSLNEGNTVYVKSSELPEADGTYNITTVNSQGVTLQALTGEYSAIKGQTFTVPVEAYTMTAENMTPAEAESASDGRGAAHYAGSTSFNVTASADPVNVSLTCTMDNAKVTFDYDETFTNMFHMETAEGITQTPTIVVTPSNSLTADRTVTLIGDITHDNTLTESYYTVNDNGTSVSFTITAARKSDGTVKTFESATPISLEKKTWHKVRIAASTSNGLAKVTIYVDGTIVEAEEVTVTVDPFSN